LTGFLYLESSAIVKLIAPEKETDALRAFIAAWSDRVSSLLSRIEVFRALRRTGALLSETRRAEDMLGRIDLIPIDRDIVDAAWRLDPPELRTLDSVHLASALSLGADLGGFVTYDARLARAATQAGLNVLAPR
jgi:predicted nucleic acid-binding protein